MEASSLPKCMGVGVSEILSLSEEESLVGVVVHICYCVLFTIFFSPKIWPIKVKAVSELDSSLGGFRFPASLIGRLVAASSVDYDWYGEASNEVEEEPDLEWDPRALSDQGEQSELLLHYDVLFIHLLSQLKVK
jgi:hypothetical protein